MLVLARQRDQAIMIGHDIEVSVVDIRGDKVRLGINAPRSVSVHRKEIYDQIRKENQQAAEVRPEDVSAVVASPPGQTLKLADDNPRPGDPFLRAAIHEAQKSGLHGGLPIGAVLIRAARIIGRGHNRRVQRGDPMAHAEIDCLTNAGRQKTYRDTILYSTLMPCLMCAGAILQFGIPKLVVGDSTNFPGGQCKHASAQQMLRECGVEVVELRDPECTEMMANFIREKPDVWNEDIGA
jgi:cytosine/creatinine deaminase